MDEDENDKENEKAHTDERNRNDDIVEDFFDSLFAEEENLTPIYTYLSSNTSGGDENQMCKDTDEMILLVLKIYNKIQWNLWMRNQVHHQLYQ